MPTLEPYDEDIIRVSREQTWSPDRVASLFRRRAFNIDSLHVAPRDSPKCRADHHGRRGIRQARASSNLYKLVNVILVDNITMRRNRFAISR